EGRRGPDPAADGSDEDGAPRHRPRPRCRPGDPGRGGAEGVGRNTSGRTRPRRAGLMTGAMTFTEPTERTELRAAVSAFASEYGQEYYRARAKEGAYLTDLWKAAGELGYLGVNIPEEYGGGGGGIGDLAAVLEELSAAGCPTLMMVVSPAICGTVLSRFGTPEQRQRWLPGLADASTIMAFAITEPDAGSKIGRASCRERAKISVGSVRQRKE